MPRQARRRCRTPKQNRAGAPPFGDPHADLLALWAIRILIDLNGMRKYDNAFFLNQNSVLHAVGIDDSSTENLDKAQLRDLLLSRRTEVEALKPELSGPMAHNLHLLAECLSLTQSDIEILAFIVSVQVCEPLAEIVGTLGELDTARLISALSVIIALPLEAVREALSREGTLISSGLVGVHGKGSQVLQHKVTLLSGLSDGMLLEQSDPVDLLKPFFRPAEPPRLTADAFAYVQEDYGLLASYIKAGREGGETGMNVLLHGLPGVGKTQLVRTLVEDLGLTLYEVSTVTESGDPIEGQQRFSAYQLSQAILARKTNGVLLFDEASDVFPEPPLPLPGLGPSANGRKAWVNRVLETNPVPAIWVMNQVSHIDPAFLRRYDLVLELRKPNVSVRRKIVEKYSSKLPVSDAWKERAARNENLQPGHIERAARVASLVNKQAKGDVDGVLDKVLSNTFSALGVPYSASGHPTYPTPYRLDVLNPDTSLERLTEGLKRNPMGRVCLYGVPGSGKTAYAHYLAAEIGKSVLVKRGSDLMSKYVGETEKNLAAMFKEAEADQAVLLLDEADGFLRDRTGAHRRWEVSQTNELLVQMEAFQGLFVISTNLMNTLDAASLRRFDLKIRFNYMRPAQAWLLFVQVMQERGFPEKSLPSDVRQRLWCLTHLTPGDFATALRKERILGDTFDPDGLLEALESECAVKPEVRNHRSIGFTATL